MYGLSWVQRHVRRRLLGASGLLLSWRVWFSVVEIVQMWQFAEGLVAVELVEHFLYIVVTYGVVIILLAECSGCFAGGLSCSSIRTAEVAASRRAFSIQCISCARNHVGCRGRAYIRSELHGAKSVTTRGEHLNGRLPIRLGFLSSFSTQCARRMRRCGPAGVRWNIGLVMVVAMLLGLVLAFATHDDQAAWWEFVGATFIGIIPTAMEVVSLLVVRSCGYRLVRRSTLPG